MPWTDLFFVTFEAHPDGLARYTPAIDVAYWQQVGFYCSSDKPIRFVMEADGQANMDRAVALIEHPPTPSLAWVHRGQMGFQYIRGVFYVPSDVSWFEAWVRGFYVCES